MPLVLHRVLSWPGSLKILTLVMTISLMITLANVKISPPGTSLVWLAVGLSFFFDISFIAMLTTERDSQLFPVRGVTYFTAETAVSLALLVFYAIAFVLCINSEEMTDDNWFIASAIFALINTILFACNTVLFLRKWLAEHRQTLNEAGLENDIFDQNSYGSPDEA
ncbi:unnamed protein product [Caenorhabditis auriculariae]|uniref:MARVEL domain-containing protein n=1 Tax=Caenorhabditis auriculariae TaxID=2777116 RepID=A0A8S1HHX0_9PELO|nr:unnamed protein product [Caenorhabditis auriculariae]